MRQVFPNISSFNPKAFVLYSTTQYPDIALLVPSKIGLEKSYWRQHRLFAQAGNQLHHDIEFGMIVVHIHVISPQALQPTQTGAGKPYNGMPPWYCSNSCKLQPSACYQGKSFYKSDKERVAFLFSDTCPAWVSIRARIASRHSVHHSVLLWMNAEPAQAVHGAQHLPLAAPEEFAVMSSVFEASIIFLSSSRYRLPARTRRTLYATCFWPLDRVALLPGNGQ